MRVAFRYDHDGTARVYYTDRHKAWAEENGFAQHEMYQYEKYGPMEGPLEKMVSSSELYDFHESLNDETFHRWREGRPSSPPEAS